MRCSNSNCGWQGNGNFCQSCGSKMIDIPAEVLIKCNGTFEGQPCGADWKQTQNFCTKCGTRIDKSLFKLLSEKCERCETILEPGSLFCAECGLKKEASKDAKTEKETVRSADQEASTVDTTLSPSDDKACSTVEEISDRLEGKLLTNNDEITRNESVREQTENSQFEAETCKPTDGNDLELKSTSYEEGETNQKSPFIPIDDVDASNDNKTGTGEIEETKGNQTEKELVKRAKQDESTFERNNVLAQSNEKEGPIVAEINDKHEGIPVSNDDKISRTLSGTVSEQTERNDPEGKTSAHTGMYDVESKPGYTEQREDAQVCEPILIHDAVLSKANFGKKVEKTGTGGTKSV
ncbi:uncharacterized protein LOC132753536 [Ruditapes philippinarum]|uniref:uncharacterized protein LOC132753536 n=1 Tax=Ruditapes philippinarum TaxID=129788 RepID=UPI00295A7675|nr:uncharacterized protein LOC132753536 [Ruditapes philippinarum]